MVSVTDMSCVLLAGLCHSLEDMRPTAQASRLGAWKIYFK